MVRCKGCTAQDTSIVRNRKNVVQADFLYYKVCVLHDLHSF